MVAELEHKYTDIENVEHWNKVIRDNIEANKLMIIDFYATWCGPCKAIAPQFTKASEKYTDVSFIKVDADKNKQVLEDLNITGLPTFLVVKEKSVIDKLVGGSPSRFDELIKKHCAPVSIEDKN